MNVHCILGYNWSAKQCFGSSQRGARMRMPNFIMFYNIVNWFVNSNIVANFMAIRGSLVDSGLPALIADSIVTFVLS
jgi:hypothetical protein